MPYRIIPFLYDALWSLIACLAYGMSWTFTVTALVWGPGAMFRLSCCLSYFLRRFLLMFGLFTQVRYLYWPRGPCYGRMLKTSIVFKTERSGVLKSFVFLLLRIFVFLIHAVTYGRLFALSSIKQQAFKWFKKLSCKTSYYMLQLHVHVKRNWISLRYQSNSEHIYIEVHNNERYIEMA